MSEEALLALTADIVSAHLSANSVAAGELPNIIKSVHDALKHLTSPPMKPDLVQEPAVSIRSSVKPDYIVCLEDGRKMKMLRRYLKTTYRMTPEQYRDKWKLPANYPMVAPNYAEQRRALAKQIGLGKKRTSTATKPAVRKTLKIKS